MFNPRLFLVFALPQSFVAIWQLIILAITTKKNDRYYTQLWLESKLCQIGLQPLPRIEFDANEIM